MYNVCLFVHMCETMKDRQTKEDLMDTKGNIFVVLGFILEHLLKAKKHQDECCMKPLSSATVRTLLALCNVSGT